MNRVWREKKDERVSRSECDSVDGEISSLASPLGAPGRLVVSALELEPNPNDLQVLDFLSLEPFELFGQEVENADDLQHREPDVLRVEPLYQG